ncbi:ABC transporter ATP-binding protein [Mesorhizobium loti]|uniref:Quaternary amine transport ATP-binding protein n=1 Tax=Rhizobium loti TaxID=381 RepID=A0A117N288_RHILI|nr:ABC transporter ATP-binding protein [Mesorhizobium loti]
MTELRSIKIACRNVWKAYGSRPAFYFDSRGYKIDPDALAERLRSEGHLPAVVDASFEVATGEIFVIMGLSGSGKSTLVRCLSRLVEPSAGEILLDGRDLLKVSGKELIELRRHEMGMVFQNFGLLPHLTVLENVAFPLKIQKKSPKEREGRAREMIALVGLDGREASFPHQLSGGQQQRVGIARSLAVGPALWFLDEPFSALDPLIRRQMQDEFIRLQKMLKKTIIFITHDIAEAFRVADRLAIMRAGKIVQIGRPSDIVLNPADDYVAQFTEDMPLLRVIKVGDLATPADGAELYDEADASASIEELIPRIAGGVKSFSVLPANGVRRMVAAADVLAVLKRDVCRRSL